MALSEFGGKAQRILFADAETWSADTRCLADTVVMQVEFGGRYLADNKGVSSRDRNSRADINPAFTLTLHDVRYAGVYKANPLIQVCLADLGVLHRVFASQ